MWPARHSGDDAPHRWAQLVQAGRAAGERVFEILDEDAEPGVVSAIVDRAAGITDRGYSPRVIGDIRFEDVSFSYAEGLPALRRISFHASPGTTIALFLPADGKRKSECESRICFSA